MPTWSLLQIREAWRWHIHQIFPCTRMHAPGSSRCTSLSLKKAKQCSYSVRIVRCSSCFLQLVKTERVSTTRSVSHKIRAGFRQAESFLHFSFQATSAARTLWRRGLSVYFLTYLINWTILERQRFLSGFRTRSINGSRCTCIKLYKNLIIIK